jgi:hypothetical protein
VVRDCLEGWPSLLAGVKKEVPYFFISLFYDALSRSLAARGRDGSI